MAHEPEANPGLAGAYDPADKMQPRTSQDAPMPAVELSDAGLDALGGRRSLPSPFDIETLRQPFQQVEQTVALRQDKSCNGRRGDRQPNEQRGAYCLAGIRDEEECQTKEREDDLAYQFRSEVDDGARAGNARGDAMKG